MDLTNAIIKRMISTPATANLEESQPAAKKPPIFAAPNNSNNSVFDCFIGFS